LSPATLTATQKAQIQAHLRAAILGRLTPTPEPDPPAPAPLAPDADKTTRQRYFAALVDVGTLSDWEQEHWDRYGWIFYPETDAGREIFRLQKQEMSVWR
jgi:hypothetical protein